MYIVVELIPCADTGVPEAFAVHPQRLPETVEIIATGLTGTGEAATLVIGDVAMIMHGLERQTEDVDLAAPAAVVYRIQKIVGSDD